MDDYEKRYRVSSISCHGSLPPKDPLYSPRSRDNRPLTKIPFNTYIITFATTGDLSYGEREFFLRYYYHIYGDKFMDYFIKTLIHYSNTLYNGIMSREINVMELYNVWNPNSNPDYILTDKEKMDYALALSTIVRSIGLNELGHQNLNIYYYHRTPDPEYLRGFIYKYDLSQGIDECEIVEYDKVTKKMGIQDNYGCMYNSVTTEGNVTTVTTKLCISDVNNGTYNNNIRSVNLYPDTTLSINNIVRNTGVSLKPLVIFLNCCKELEYVSSGSPIYPQPSYGQLMQYSKTLMRSP